MEGGRRIKRLEFIRETLAAAYVNQQQKTTTKNGTMAAAGDKCRQGACVRVSMCLRAANIDWLLASSLPGLVVGDKRRRIREAVGGHITPIGPPIFSRLLKSAKILTCIRWQIFSLFFSIFFGGGVRFLCAGLRRYFLDPPHRSSTSESIGEVLVGLM